MRWPPKPHSDRPRRRRRWSRSCTLASGIAPAITDWHDTLAGPARRCSSTCPTALQGRVLRVGRDDAARRRVAGRRCGSATTSAARPTTAAPPRKNVAPPAATTSAPACGCRRCCATPPPALMHSFIYFGFLVAVHRDGRSSSSTTSCPDSLKFLHGQTYEALLVRRRPRRRRVPRSASAGRSSAATSQRPYRIRIKTKPEDAVILGTFLIIGVTGFFIEGARIALDRPARRSRSGRSSATRSSSLVDTWSPQHAQRHAPVAVGHARRRVPRVPRDPADHEAAPHVHVADEHVPEGPRPAQGRDEAHAEPDGDRARELRRRQDRGLHVEAAVRHRRVHDLRTLHLGVPGARDRQAARPARDRAEGRRGDGRDRRPGRVAARRRRPATSRSAPTACSSASRPRSSGRARAARRATRSAR